MNNRTKIWTILTESSSNKNSHTTSEIKKILLANRGIITTKQQNEFFNPTDPDKLIFSDFGIKEDEFNKLVRRLKIAKKKRQKVVIYGDYDADGVCATAIIWEVLYACGFDVIPHIPERFSEGYGINGDSLRFLKKKYKNLGFIITVDNGIVAAKEVDIANELGIDVVITDHHQKDDKKPKSYATIHTTLTSGSAIAWFLAKKINEKFKIPKKKLSFGDGLDIACIGTIADQIPLLGINRSIVKFGLGSLNNTKRPGLLALFYEAGLRSEKKNKYSPEVVIGPYEVGFIIAPRINASGRLGSAIESLRLLCTKTKPRALELAGILAKTNQQRQKIVEEVVVHAKAQIKDIQEKKVIVLAHETYHEGVIGLAASRLVEEYYKPAIVISTANSIAKASARSVSGFNIIEGIRKLGNIIEGGGGHPMAAGFSITSSKIDLFINEFEKMANPLLTEEILTKKLKIDLYLDFDRINWELVDLIKTFEPTGLGNPSPIFASKNVKVLDARVVGKEGRHLKLKLAQNQKVMDAIAFGLGERLLDLSPEKKIKVAYQLEENVWNSQRTIQLKVKDLTC